jgi:hypothetical protein
MKFCKDETVFRGRMFRSNISILRNMDTKNKTKTNFENFRDFTKKIVSVPKSEIDRREAEYQKSRKNKGKRGKL